jgi:hypothetical protein
MPATIEKIGEVKLHQLFLRLNIRQQSFLLAYLTSDDITASVRVAGYNCKTDNSARTLGQIMLKHESVRILVDLAFGRASETVSKEEMLVLLSKHLRTTRDVTIFCKMSTMYAQLKGWTIYEKKMRKGKPIKRTPKTDALEAMQRIENLERKNRKETP